MIVIAPNPVLSLIAKEIKNIDSYVLKTIEEMKKDLLKASDPIGVGLAAPQIGVSLRIFITKQSPKSKISVFINPEIIHNGSAQAKLIIKNSSRDKESQTKLEGCLSLQNIWGEVKRLEDVTISYLDETSKKQTKNFKGLMAIIVQHEIDHLNGILFPKKVLEQKGILYKSHKNKKNEDIFDEIKL